MAPKARPTIAVDARTYSEKQVYTGTSVYLTSILEPLLAAGFQITLISNAPLNMEHSVIEGCKVAILPSSSNISWEFKVLPRYLKNGNYDIYFAPGNRGISWRKIPQTRCVLAFLDAIPYKFPRYYLFKNKGYFLRHELIPQLVSLFCADDIITISHSSLLDIKQIFFRKNIVELPFNLTAPRIINPRVAKKQFVYVGGDNPRKRIANLGKAFLIFRKKHPDYRLVLIGRADPRFDPELNRLSLQESVITTGYISEAEKFNIISESTAMVFPSLYEGFGLAIAEGIQAGVPVLAGDGGAQREVGGEAVLRIDPQDVSSIATAMEKVLQPEVQKRLGNARDIQKELLVGQHNAKAIVEFFSRQVILARKMRLN